jgi:transposase
VSQSTLYRHARAIDAGGTPLSAEKNQGHPGLLTGEQWEVVAGAVLVAEEKVDLQWVVDFVDSAFGMDVSTATVSRHLADLNITLQLVGKRPMPKGMTRSQYVTQYFEFVLTLDQAGFFKTDPKRIICVDSTSNSYRLERVKTYNIRGGKQKKFSAAKPTFTNNYLKAWCMDDMGQYPCYMFTHDPAFKEGGKRWKEVLEWCKAWSIQPSQIVYVEGGKQYCAEASWQVGHFLDEYRDSLRGAHVVHDAGNSFKIDQQWILADGAGMHYVFPSAPHGELSVNDNHLFAIAKAYWRAEREQYCGNDFSKQALYLVYCIDWVKSEAVRKCWTQNFLLDLPKPTLKACDERLKANNRLTFANQTRMYQYMEAYNEWLKEHDSEGQEEVFEALNSTLDGVYWK